MINLSKFNAEDVVRLLNGTETYFERCVGYCNLHYTFLTITQLKSKQCLRKQCKHLQKIETHQFWIDREAKSRQRKKRKNGTNMLSRIKLGIQEESTKQLKESKRNRKYFY